MPERTSERLQTSCTPDIRLAEALESTVENALTRSVRHQPQMWAEAIFPIVLPAIRMAVANALREMVQTLNQILEHSLSLQSWRWRLESWRTGRPFSEVVLLRTLVYRVEQVLLIDRKSGLLLLSIAAPNVATQDPKLVSAMLTAIQDFVHESFDVEKCADIRELHVGDFSLWVEQGPGATIAAAVRGNAPAELRETLRAAVDLVHQEFGVELRQFQGDSRRFEPCRAILEGCLQSRYQSVEKPSNWKAWLCLATLAMGATAWVGLRLHQARQWDRVAAALQGVPGILITHGSRQAGHYVMEGFRDPLAESPQNILASQGIDVRNVSMRLRPFLSLDPGLVLERARIYLQPPDSVSISLDQDVLIIRGSASHEWIMQARKSTRQLGMAGIRELRTEDLRDNDLESLQGFIEKQSIVFPIDSSAIGQKQARVASVVAAQSLQWIRDAIAVGRTPTLQVIGYTDSSGTLQRNRALGEERAAHVAASLRAASVPQEVLQVVGREASPSNGEDPALQRKVVFQLSLSRRDVEGRGAR